MHNNSGAQIAGVDFRDFQSMSNMQADQGFGLQHATSLEQHIVQKIQNKLKVDESFFEYEKSLRFRNPLNRFQLASIVLSIMYLIIYPIVYATSNYNAETCSFTTDQKLGLDGFLI